MQEPMTISQIRTAPSREVINSMSLWAEILGDVVAQVEGGEVVVNTEQIRLRINKTPVIQTWLRNFQNLEVTFRGETYKVVSRDERQYTASLICELGEV